MTFYINDVSQGISHDSSYNIAQYNIRFAISATAISQFTLKAMSCIPFNPVWTVSDTSSLNVIGIQESGTINSFSGLYVHKSFVTTV